MLAPNIANETISSQNKQNSRRKIREKKNKQTKN